MTSEARNEGSLRRLVLLAFAKWDPCVYMGVILCDECPSKDCGDGDTCDMYHGRIGYQKAFEAGWDHKPNAALTGSEAVPSNGVVRKGIGIMSEEDANTYDDENNYANREDADQSSRSGLHWTHS